MNRLSPLIVRHTGLPALTPRSEWSPPAPPVHPLLSVEAKDFLLGWLGGLVFFGTFLA